MATSLVSPPRLSVSHESRPLMSPGVQDDDILWTEYLKEASNADSRLIKDWTKVIDVLLVFVRASLRFYLIGLSQSTFPRSHFSAAF